jgi:hypothetical protein
MKDLRGISWAFVFNFEFPSMIFSRVSAQSLVLLDVLVGSDVSSLLFRPVAVLLS